MKKNTSFTILISLFKRLKLGARVGFSPTSAFMTESANFLRMSRMSTNSDSSASFTGKDDSRSGVTGAVGSCSSSTLTLGSLQLRLPKNQLFLGSLPETKKQPTGFPTGFEQQKKLITKNLCFHGFENLGFTMFT